MTMTIPTPPKIVAGQVVTADDLNAVGSCVSFLLNKPIVRVRENSGGAWSFSSSGTILFASSPNIEVDTDGMWDSVNNDRMIVQTPGWYKLYYQITVNGTGDAVNAAAYCTTGSNNPEGAGVTIGPYWASYCDGFPGALQARGVWPFYLYAGDYVRLKGFSASGDANPASSYVKDLQGNSGQGTVWSMEYVGCNP